MGKIGENPIWLPEILFFPIFHFFFNGDEKKNRILFSDKKEKHPQQKKKTMKWNKKLK